MSEEQFLKQTPVQWHRIMGAWLNRERRENYRVARICMVLANVHGNDTTEDDFMPKSPDDEVEQSQEEMLSSLISAAPGVKRNG